MREKAVRFLWRKKKNPCWLFHFWDSLYLRPALVFFSYFLLDVFQEGCPGIHDRFEGIFTTRCHALVGVKQHGEFPVGFVDFIPTRKKPSCTSATGSAPTHGTLAVWTDIISLAVRISQIITTFSQKWD